MQVSPTPLSLTVVICAHNAARRLPACLHSLAASTLPAHLWDVLVIDNASTDNTQHIALSEWKRSDVKLMVVVEPVPGQLNARMCGVRHAKGEIIVFVDDDNLVSEAYLEKVRAAFLRDNRVVVFGGRGIGRFEQEPPEWLGADPRYLAVGPQAKGSGYIALERGYVYGACSAFRRYRLQQIYQKGDGLECVGRTGAGLASGDDVEICLLILATGGVIYYDEDATFEHCIEARRLEWNYQIRLFEGFGTANAWLGLLRRQLLRHQGVTGRVKATIGYTLLQAFACTFLNLVFAIVPWSRLPKTKRTLNLRSFAAMCRAIRQRESSIELHQKVMALVQG